MIKIKVPATSANLGVGFDVLGIALDIYNTYYVRESDKLIIEGVEEKYQTKDNLFVVAFNEVCTKLNVKKNIYVRIENDIPISRGLGSSASLYVAGALAANTLNNNKLNLQEIFEICTKLEGHPDNIASALFGGFTASLMHENKPYTKQIKVHDKYKFTVLIPDFKISTNKARNVLPHSYYREDVVSNMSSIAHLILALNDGDDKMLSIANNDKIHEPYRKTLIEDFDTLKNECLKNNAYTFTISGSGSSCLVISDDKDFSKKINTSNLKNNWTLIDCNIHLSTPIIEEITDV
ncbi:MAG: homoserine kinase [Erysipelotrichaceae bacterium]|nr:homoserine kinase [Erysipelotrichaceae bacterium]